MTTSGSYRRVMRSRSFGWWAAASLLVALALAPVIVFLGVREVAVPEGRGGAGLDSCGRVLIEAPNPNSSAGRICAPDREAAQDNVWPLVWLDLLLLVPPAVYAASRLASFPRRRVMPSGSPAGPA